VIYRSSIEIYEESSFGVPVFDNEIGSFFTILVYANPGMAQRLLRTAGKNNFGIFWCRRKALSGSGGNAE
jgi:hypothetical protein